MLWIDNKMLNTNISLKNVMNSKEYLLGYQLVRVGVATKEG